MWVMTSGVPGEGAEKRFPRGQIGRKPTAHQVRMIICQLDLPLRPRTMESSIFDV